MEEVVQPSRSLLCVVGVGRFLHVEVRPCCCHVRQDGFPPACVRPWSLAVGVSEHLIGVHPGQHACFGKGAPPFKHAVLGEGNRGVVRHVASQDSQPPFSFVRAERGHYPHGQELGVAMFQVSAAVCYADPPPVPLMLAENQDPIMCFVKLNSRLCNDFLQEHDLQLCQY